MPDKEKERYIIEAKDWLRLARERAKEHGVSTEVKQLKEYARKAGIAVEEIGTSEEELKGLLVEGDTAEAKDWLRLARERAKEHGVKAEVRHIREYARKAGIAVEEIGTTLEELTELRKQGNVSNAKLLLRLVQEKAGKGDVEMEVKRVRQHASDAGVTLEEIGTSEKKLKGLLVKGNIAASKDWLRLARERAEKGDVEMEVKRVRQHASDAGVTLEEIGTSEKKLKGLLVKGNIAASKDWLRLARERAEKGDVEMEVKRVRQHASDAGVTLEEIGTSEKELEELLSK